MVVARKRCNRCKRRKPVELGFYRDKHAPDGYQYACKVCHGERNGSRAYASLLRRRYGITLMDYEFLHRKQNGRCAICRKRKVGRLKLDGKPARLYLMTTRQGGCVVCFVPTATVALAAFLILQSY
jgi:hypothetical protein